ncbi:MAG: hypothetical protein ACI4RP_02220 [Acutalibacteraceae bacterium]
MVRASPHQSPEGDSFPPRGSLNSFQDSYPLSTLHSPLSISGACTAY